MPQQDYVIRNITPGEIHDYIADCTRFGATARTTPEPDGTFTIVCSVDLATHAASPQDPFVPAPMAEPRSAAGSAALLPSASPGIRETDLATLHPAFRMRAERVIAELRENGIPLRVFETFRSPERQRMLFCKGRQGPRIVDRSRVVTHTDAWGSFHQYGLAMDMVIDHPDYDLWDTHGEAADWWDAYHRIARAHGLAPLSFELVHIQLDGVRASDLRAGAYPAGGDDSWADTLNAAIARWPEDRRPPMAGGAVPSPIIARAGSAGRLDWASLPRVASSAPQSRNGGRAWRVEEDGVWLEGASAPARTPGAPLTCARIVDLYADEIAAASSRYGIAPELIVMTIATGTAESRREDFTGPRTFRWEPEALLSHTGDPYVDGREQGDYRAGPMQLLSSTARRMNAYYGLGYAPTSDLAWFKTEPAAPRPGTLGLYEGSISIDLGAAYIAFQSAARFTTPTAADPILVAAAYDAGTLRASGTNAWGLRVTGDRLDRAAAWFGDACAVLTALGR